MSSPIKYPRPEGDELVCVFNSDEDECPADLVGFHALLGNLIKRIPVENRATASISFDPTTGWIDNTEATFVVEYWRLATTPIDAAPGADE